MLHLTDKRPSDSHWPPPAQAAPRCGLCGRAAPYLTEHHLIPKSRGRRGVPIYTLPTVMLCPSCHKFLHKTFSNAELENEYGSVAKLLAHEDVARFVKWLGKQPATKNVRVR